jgi:hypothetical protein
MKNFEPDETKSPDLIAENTEQLKALFPEAFTVFGWLLAGRTQCR